MISRRTLGATNEGGGRHAAAPPRRFAVLVVPVALVSIALIVAGVVLLARGPQAERLDPSARLAAAAPVSAASSVSPTPPTPAPPSATSSAGSSGRSRTSGWPVRSAALTPPPDDSVGRPTRLDLPALGVRLPVRATGVDDHGAMALPERPGDLGWYRFGARPSDKRGSTVLGGHVDSREYGTGPLAGLWRLRPGDRLSLTTTTGRHDYEVTAVQRIAKSDLDSRQVFDRDGPPVLRLLTCGGAYLPERGGYQDNVVVTARPR